MVNSCPALYRVYPNSPLRFVDFQMETKLLGEYKIDLPYDFPVGSHTIATLPEFAIAEVIGYFLKSKDLFGIIFVNQTYNVWVHADRLLVLESGRTNPEEFRDAIDLTPQLELSKSLENVGFERTVVYSPAHFAGYSRILLDRARSRYFYNDTWHNTSDKLVVTNKKVHYMKLMLSPHKGVLCKGDDDFVFLD